MEKFDDHNLFMAIALCYGESKLDMFTSIMTNSDITHTLNFLYGDIVIVKKKKLIDFDGDDLLVIHYPGMKIKDGIKIERYDDWIKTFNGKVIIKEVSNIAKITNDKEKMEKFHKWVNDMLRKDHPYERDLMQFVKSGIPNLVPKGKDKNKSVMQYFCTEFNADAYRQLGMLPSFVEPYSYLPKLFAEPKHVKLFKESTRKLKIDKKQHEKELKSFLKNKDFIFCGKFGLKHVKTIERKVITV